MSNPLDKRLKIIAQIGEAIRLRGTRAPSINELSEWQAYIASEKFGAGEATAETINLSVYELQNIDELISAFEILGGDYYDTLWNLRNRIKPFVEGDTHFDPEFPA